MGMCVLIEVLDEGGEDGVFKETLNALRPDQIRTFQIRNFPLHIQYDIHPQ